MTKHPNLWIAFKHRPPPAVSMIQQIYLPQAGQRYQMPCGCTGTVFYVHDHRIACRRNGGGYCPTCKPEGGYYGSTLIIDFDD